MSTKFFGYFFLLGFLFSSPVFSNVVGSDFQNFNPTSNGIDFVTVQSGQTLRPGVFNLGLFLNYGVNAIPEFKDEKPYNAPRGKTRNTGLFSDFNLGLGLASFWDVGLSFPAVLDQNVKDEGERIQYEATGVNEFRLNTKFRLLGGAKNALAIMETINLNRIENNPYAGSPSKPIFTTEIVGHVSVGNSRVGMNVGYRKKQPGEKIPELVADPFYDQMIYSLGYSYLLKSVDSKIILEFFGSEPVQKNKTPTESLQKSGEALLGIKYDITSTIAFHAGATIGVIDSPATPDWRVYSGVNWNGGPVWGKKSQRKVNRPVKKPEPKIKPEAEPAKEVVPVIEPESRETFVLDNILFATDSSNLVVEGAFAELDELVQHLKTIPAWSSLSVEGHTDSVGEDAYNLDLSQRRAESIRAFLLQKLGVAPDKIKAVGYGESRPVADNENFQGRQQNRRVEIKIFD